MVDYIPPESSSSEIEDIIKKLADESESKIPYSEDEQEDEGAVYYCLNNPCNEVLSIFDTSKAVAEYGNQLMNSDSAPTVEINILPKPVTLITDRGYSIKYARWEIKKYVPYPLNDDVELKHIFKLWSDDHKLTVVHKPILEPIPHCDYAVTNTNLNIESVHQMRIGNDMLTAEYNIEWIRDGKVFVIANEGRLKVMSEDEYEQGGVPSVSIENITVQSLSFSDVAGIRAKAIADVWSVNVVRSGKLELGNNASEKDADDYQKLLNIRDHQIMATNVKATSSVCSRSGCDIEISFDIPNEFTGVGSAVASISKDGIVEKIKIKAPKHNTEIKLDVMSDDRYITPKTSFLLNYDNKTNRLEVCALIVKGIVRTKINAVKLATFSLF